MKLKTWLYPLLLFVCTLAVIVALFFPLYNLIYSHDGSSTILELYSWFSSFATLDPSYIIDTYSIPVTIGAFITIAGVFATSYLLIAFVGLLFSAIVTLLRLIGVNIEKYTTISKVISAILLIGTIAFIVSAILFLCLNQSGVTGSTDASVGLSGTFALWTIMAGLVLGTIASYSARHDIMEEDAENLERAQPALTQVPAKESKTKVKTSSTKKQTVNKKTKKTTSKTESKKTNTPKINKPIKTETKKTTIKKVQPKQEDKKTTTAKKESKKTTTKTQTTAKPKTVKAKPKTTKTTPKTNNKKK